MAAGSIQVVSGSQSVTGTFGVVTALAYSDITISGSGIGESRMDLQQGMSFYSLHTDSTNKTTYSDNSIQKIVVHNSYGQVLAQKLQVD
jgi:hypothetical protein